MNWINAKDRLPKNGSECLIFVDGKIKEAWWSESCHLFSDNSCCCASEWSPRKYEIYWMPIDDIPAPEMK